jgi:hypothetical protein
VSPLPTSIQRVLHLFCESARPNPALNRTRHCRPARAGRRHAVHFRQPALAFLPRRAG